MGKISFFSGSFINDQKGALMITFAVMINVLILAIALPMDLGRAYMASSAIAGAADAGAVASAVEGGDDDTAKAYFMANLPVGTLGISYNYDMYYYMQIDSMKLKLHAI